MQNTQQLQRKIAVVTGTRAEYGLLKNLLSEIKNDDALQLQLIVTGMHLSPEFGLTYREIQGDGFEIAKKVEMMLSSDHATGIAKSVAIGLIGFVDALNDLQPDLIVMLGDRFEILSAAQAALFLKIPIAHIHGGELSLGAIDDAIRHAITKMASLHFTSTEVYRQRVIQMGEQPSTVFNVGALGVERLKKMTRLSRQECENQLKISMHSPLFLVTYHPATRMLGELDSEMNALFSALDAFPQAQIIITKSNADEGGRYINQRIENYAEKNKHRVAAFVNLGETYYPSVMYYSDVMIGNSSSGIIEAPTFGKPVVNIGLRQEGRVKSAAIIDCVLTADAITQAIEKSLSHSWREHCQKTVSPYDGNHTAATIKNKLKDIVLNELQMKPFYNLQTHQDLIYA